MYCPPRMTTMIASNVKQTHQVPCLPDQEEQDSHHQEAQENACNRVQSHIVNDAKGGTSGLPPGSRRHDARKRGTVDRNFMTVTNGAKQGKPVKIEVGPAKENKQSNDRKGVETTAHKSGTGSNKFDWTKSKKIVTSKQLVTSRLFLCFWVNQAPQWVKEALIPRSLVKDYDTRIKNRKILQQLWRPYGNMN